MTFCPMSHHVTLENKKNKYFFIKKSMSLRHVTLKRSVTLVNVEK